MAFFYTFKDLQDECLGWLDERSESNTRLLIKTALNQAHLDRLTLTNWPFMLWDTPETFTTTVGTRQYSLNPEYHRPYYFFNRTTKEYLIEVPGRSLQETGAKWNSDTGPAKRFAVWGTSPVWTQPTAATGSVITIRSNSDNDATAAKNVVVTGYSISEVVVSPGGPDVLYPIGPSSGVRTETLTPAGMATVSGTTKFTKILRLTKKSVWSGTLVVIAGTDTLLTLQPTEVARSYPQLSLLNSPDAIETIEYRFYRQPFKLTEDDDVPEIPPPFQQILVWDALIAFAGYNTDISPTAVGVWSVNRAKLEEGMRHTFLEGQSLASEPRYIRYLPDEEGWW